MQITFKLAPSPNLSKSQAKYLKFRKETINNSIGNFAANTAFLIVVLANIKTGTGKYLP